jgi:hypothetical protein
MTRRCSHPVRSGGDFPARPQYQVHLDDIGRHHVYGLSVPTDPATPTDRQFVDAVRGRQIVELVRGAKVRPSVVDRRINQLMPHQRPFTEGMGWQDFLADHTVDTPPCCAGCCSI